MNKILLTLAIATFLSAQVYDGVAIVVKDSAITLLDIKNEMRASSTTAKQASDILIRKELEKLEINDRKISVSGAEVYEDIKKMASSNKLSISEFYDAIRESNGLSSSELKAKIKQRLLSQKLYSSIAYSSVGEPSGEEVEEYFNIHKDEYNHPSEFVVTIYTAKNQSRLYEKIVNPMIYAPDITSENQTLEYARVSPELAKLLEETPLNSFTPIVPSGNGEYMSFYLQDVKTSNGSNIDVVRGQIMNEIVAQKREQVLGDYFARLKHNADINIIREVK